MFLKALYCVCLMGKDECLIHSHLCWPEKIHGLRIKILLNGGNDVLLYSFSLSFFFWFLHFFKVYCGNTHFLAER